MLGKRILALDIGGSFIKSALFVDGAPVRRFAPIPSRSDGDADAIGRALRRAVEAAGPVDGIGAAIPGPFDYARGVSLMEHKFGSIRGRALSEYLGPAPVRYMHDANAFLWGEWKRGAGRGLRRVGGITLGTGIGAAFMADGCLRTNDLGSPAEDASLWARPFRGGRVEDYCSARALLAACPAGSVKELAERARAGEAAPREAWRAFGVALAEALAPWLEALRPEAVIVGGQIAQSLDLFGEPLAALPIRPSALGARAALEGAAGLFFPAAESRT